MAKTLNLIFLLGLLSLSAGSLLQHTLPIKNLLGRNVFKLFSPDLNPYYNKEICINNVTLEPEAYMTTVEIIRNRGYPAEIHTVQTEDGYLLELHRIPYGLSGPSTNRPPVYIQHGLLGSSSDFILNFGNQSLGYMFADVGYDVWLGNYRGNYYTRKHVSLDPDLDAAEFWNFSFQEHGNYDLTAAIDYVLNETGYQQLTYIGHSMGTTAFFLLMANRTEYNDKIKTMIGLAPGASVSNTSDHGAAQHVNAIENILNALGYYELLPHSDTNYFLASTICSLPDPVACADLTFHGSGFEPDPDQLNTTRLPVYAAHNPAGSSVKNLYHYGQLVNDRTIFRAYNYGPIKNNEIYGQDPPPAYNLSLVTAPVALFWGQNDALARPDDVAFLAQSLPNLILNHRIDYDLWLHVDFTWAIEAEKYQNTFLVDFVISRE